MYDQLFNGLLYPLYDHVLKRRNTLTYRKELESSQWLSPETLQSRQWEAVVDLMNHAYTQSPYYRQVFDRLHMGPGDVKTFEDFGRLPLCSRQDIIDHRSDMIARDQIDRVIAKSTGGSTGMPVHFAISEDSNQWRTAAAQRGYRWAGCGPGQSTVYIWGVDVGTPTRLSRLKTGLYHRAFNRKMFNCFDFDAAEMNRCLDYIRRKRPNGIVAFTSAVYNLARFAVDQGITDCQVGAVITGAEKLYPHQRDLIEQAFNTRVFNTYGCREFMLIAAECEKHEGLHVTVDNLFVEILKDGRPAAPGESGDVVITDLHNYAMPFIRYKNGDIATQGDKPCSCGRGLPLIRDIDGRTMDEILATDGKAVSGGFFPHLMKEFDEIHKFQVIQTALNQVNLKLVLNREIPADRLEFCLNEIKKVLGDSMSVNLEYVDDIPLTRTGKVRVTISEISRL